MPQFQFVMLPLGKWRSGQENQKVNEEIQEWVAKGWEPVSVTRPAAIGPVGVLFRRDR